MAGVVGFEPTNERVKVACVWPSSPYPNNGGLGRNRTYGVSYVMGLQPTPIAIYGYQPKLIEVFFLLRVRVTSNLRTLYFASLYSVFH